MSHKIRMIIVLDEEIFSALGRDKIHKKEMIGKWIQIVHHTINSKFL